MQKVKLSRVSLKIISLACFLGAPVLANEASTEEAFYHWWEVAQRGRGPGVAQYINIESFSRLHSIGPPAVDFVIKRIEEDHMDPNIIGYAVEALKGGVPWKPSKDPIVEKNLIKTLGNPIPPSSLVANFPEWGITGEAGIFRTASHPRISKTRSLEVTSDSKNQKWAILTSKLKLETGKHFVFISKLTNGKDAERWDVHMQVEWLDGNHKLLEKHLIDVDTQLISKSRSWFSGVLPTDRPETGVFAILRLKFLLRESQLREPSSLFVDQISFSENL